MNTHSRLHAIALAAILAAGVFFITPTYALADDASEQPSIADQIKGGLDGFFTTFVFDASKMKSLDTSPLDDKAPFSYLKQLQNEISYQSTGYQAEAGTYPISIPLPGYGQLEFRLGQGIVNYSFSPWRDALTGGIIMCIVAGTIRNLLGRGD